MLREKPASLAYALTKLDKLAALYCHWGFRVFTQAQR